MLLYKIAFRLHLQKNIQSPPPLLCISDIKTTLKEGGGNMGNRPKKERETADHPWGLQ